MDELKPCPFCGCELEQMGNERLGYFYAHPSNDCLLADIDDSTGFVVILESEIEKWNRRVDNGK